METASLTVAVDTEPLTKASGLMRLAGKWGPWGLRALLLALVLTAVFASASWPAARDRITATLLQGGWRLSAILTHFCAFGLFCTFSIILSSGKIGGTVGDVLVLACAAAGVGLVLTGLTVFLPFEFWRRLWESAPWAPVYAAMTSAAALGLMFAGNAISKPWLQVTYRCVSTVLHFLRTDIVGRAADVTIGTPAFSVAIAPECSGYEGVALMVAFCGAWLWVFRREFRFPQALLMLPAGVVAIWTLNIVRIVALILLGTAGAASIAAGGFHSQAGWIAFVVLAVTFLLACERVPWISAAAGKERTHLDADPTTAYLAPFLAVLAFGMLAQAASAGFEWLYPMRVAGAGIALWWFRRNYRDLHWRFGWDGVWIGVVVFAIWVGAERILTPSARSLPMPAELAAISRVGRSVWIAFRIAGAIIAVPIVEELAFRGYLLRRFVRPDFTQVDFRRFAAVPFFASSVIFGAMHGGRWIAGVLAGLLYAEAVRRRGRIGDAIAAHATTNALLAILVLVTRDWRWW